MLNRLTIEEMGLSAVSQILDGLNLFPFARIPFTYGLNGNHG